MRRRTLLVVTTTLLLLVLSAGRGFSQTLFWENPQILENQNVRYSSSGEGAGRVVVAWEEIVPDQGGTEGVIYLSVGTSSDGIAWNYHKRFFGPVRYSAPEPGLEPLIYSMIVDSRGRIFFAVASSENEISVFSVDDKLDTQTMARLRTQLTTVTPSLFMTETGRLLLFVTQAAKSSDRAATSGLAPLSLTWSSSADGRTWSSFAPFVAADEAGSGIQLQPDLVAFKGREIVVFQAQKAGEEGYQVFVKVSQDGGGSWGKAKEVTSLPAFAETIGGTAYQATSFTNTRPRVFIVGGALWLIWERNLVGSVNPELYTVTLNESGDATASMQALTPGSSSILAQMITVGARVFLLYAQNVGGSYRIVVSEKGTTWEPQVLGRALTGSSLSPHALSLGGALIVFWENQRQVSAVTSATSLVELRPKTSVLSPALVPVGFTPGKPSRVDSVALRWRQPDDSVGIDSYEVTVRLNGIVQERRSIAADRVDETYTRPLTSDGTWSFEVTAKDVAGNRSKPSAVELLRDTEAPGPVLIAGPATDAAGYLLDNSFSVEWKPGEGKTVVGYAWEEQRVGATLDEYKASGVKLLAPPQRVMTTATKLAFDNLENGVHAISVTALDSAGNVSAPSTVIVELNKFKPFTAIYAVLKSRDELGNVILSIKGRGFVTNGAVRELYLSRAGGGAFEKVFAPGSDGFAVASDTLITGPTLDNSFTTGTYRLGLLQTLGKPYFWSGGLVSFETPGTTKLGDFSLLIPRWVGGRVPQYALPLDGILVVLLAALLVVLLVFSVRKMASLLQEGAMLRNEVTALLEGRVSMSRAERIVKMKELQKRGMGLRLKFTLLMVVLVSIIVLSVSVILGSQMVGQTRKNLAEGLQTSTRILIGNIATSAEGPIQRGLKGGGDTDIVPVPEAKSALPEAVSATITAGPADAVQGADASRRDFVWASNADRWNQVKKNGLFQPGVETQKDIVTPLVADLQRTVNDNAQKALAQELSAWQQARDRYQLLTAKKNRTAAEQTELNAIITKDLPDRKKAIDDGLRQLQQGDMGSEPAFQPGGLLAARYTFYKPIEFFDANDRSFYQGLVRLEVDTASITRQIDQSRNTLIRNTAIIALVAVLLGILGAIIMASITVTPIRKLAQGVKIIRDTDDKEKLKDHTIVVRTRDEIGDLADAVNTMTKGLVKAAIANKELLLGKDVQKRFLPLAKDGSSRKGSTAEEENDKVEVYGYYEGAKGVSGDYFDFKKLDDTHYALIKCDVAGKGVPAALIMVEVATLFISYFRDWLKRKENIKHIGDARQKLRAQQELERVDSLVYTINDMVEERGFEGRFAALTVCIFNSASGVVSICHAGDNIVHVYKGAERSVVHKELPKAPAAGTFPSMLVEMQSPYKQVPQKLESGDVLFLHTDGFEESKRYLRDASFKVAPCAEPGLKEGDWHMGTHEWGKDTEEFGTTRMDGIINAVFARGRYTLVRNHNSIPNEELEFDFSSCGGTAKEAVLALIAVEKIYRMVPDPAAGEASRVAVDAKVDTFLQQHFLQYRKYFSHPAETQSVPGYVTFTHAHEDEQYDDLTILVLRRK